MLGRSTSVLATSLGPLNLVAKTYISGSRRRPDMDSRSRDAGQRGHECDRDAGPSQLPGHPPDLLRAKGFRRCDGHHVRVAPLDRAGVVIEVADHLETTAEGLTLAGPRCRSAGTQSPSTWSPASRGRPAPRCLVTIAQRMTSRTAPHPPMVLGRTRRELGSKKDLTQRLAPEGAAAIRRIRRDALNCSEPGRPDRDQPMSPSWSLLV